MSEQPNTRARRNLPDLSKLYDSLEESKVTPRLDLTQKESDSRSAPDRQSENIPATSEKSSLHLPDELQGYLPPDLWRKLNSEAPRSAIYNNALERLNSLLYSISTYLPSDLVKEKMSRPIPGLVGGKLLKGCLLFSDVSGFTALSECLAVLGPQGAEHLTEIINQYFTAMIDILSWSNGILLKFAGDATLIYFPEQEEGAHIQWATRAGLRMLRAMQGFTNLPTPLGSVTLAMKIGLSAGSFLAASIGSPKRIEYALIGSTVAQTLQAEGCAIAGQLVTNRAAADLLSGSYELVEIKPGFFLLEPGTDSALGEFEIRPEKRRARTTMQWGTELNEIAAGIENVLRQIQALTPYLASELVDRIIAHAYQRQVQSEYRPTTVIFCNFSGPETLLEAWGEAGVQRVTGLLSAYFSAMNEIISHFGGIVSRIDPYSQGTKLLALFGAPVAHEDDPQRAVSAALAMNSALQALNQRWAQKLARHLPPDSQPTLIEHRIGITLGETFAGQVGSSTRREYTVMGDEVNLAARLMSSAQPGQILISDPVLERIHTHYVTHKLPPVRVKGKKKPVSIWQVDRQREDTLLNRFKNRPPLVGRVAEFTRGWQIMQHALSKAGTLLTLTGPAGIGKSHLADALLKHAMETGWQVQAFQCRSYLSRDAYACWIGLLRSLAGITSVDHLLIQNEKLERLTTQFSLPAAQTAVLADLLGLRQVRLTSEVAAENGASNHNDDDLFRLVKQKKTSRSAKNLDIFNQLEEMEAASLSEATNPSDRETIRRWQALAALFSALSAKGPLVVFFEDTHWMDSASKDCLLALSKELAAQPVMFLLACRPQETTAETGEIIELKPFTRSETSDMVAAILTTDLADIIHEQSSGSPLFVEEISRWIKQTYNINETGLKNVLQASDTLQKLVLSSMESLSEGQREVARSASVIGLEFRRSEVEALLHDALDPVTLSGYLQSLKQAHLITLSEVSVDARYTFIQPIFREILYTSLSFEKRRELHARMAEHLQALPTRRQQLRDKIAVFLESSPSSNLPHELEKLAYHYEMSEQWLAAAQQLNDAAGMLKLPDQAENEALYLRALALLEHYPPEKLAETAIRLQKARAHLGLGDAAMQRGDLPFSVAAYESAASSAPPEALPATLAVGLAVRLALTLPSQGKLGPGEKQLNRLLTERPELDDWKVQAVLAWLAWRAGQNPSSRIASCLKSLPDSDDSLRVRALLDELSGSWERAVDTYQVVSEFNGVALAHIRLGDRFLRQGNLIEAGQQYALAAAIWQEQESNCGIALVHYRRAEMAWKSQHTTSVLSLLAEALSALEKSPSALQTEPRIAIQKALARVKKNQPGDWENWQWQPFDDLFRIQLLFPLFALS